MKKLYTLFVGINDYQERFKTLSGCKNDIENLWSLVHENYFTSSFEIVDYPILINKDATYKNIVDGFRNHLRKAGPDDTVWFHFSGHGTEEPTADEFLSIEPKGKDQNLICFDTWPGFAPYLADKELAVLINEVATQTVDGAPKKSPHIVISLDCCHSGTGTRDANDEIKIRAADPTNIKRIFDTYLHGYFKKQRDEQGQLNVPASKHVLLAACETFQLAGDNSRGGFFTQGLIKAIRKTKGQINYADLFMLTRAKIAEERKEQTPQFDTYENFNPFTKFLVGADFGTPDRYEMVKEDDWFVKCGAIHGLPTLTDSPIKIEIQDPANNYKVEGSAIIESVGAMRSKIDPNFKSLLGRTFRGSDPYVAVFHQFPVAPVLVKISGDEPRQNGLRKLWSTAESIHSKNIRIAGEDDLVQIEIIARENEFEIRDLELNQTATIIHTSLEDAEERVLDSVIKIVKWKRMFTLRNKNTKSQLQKKCALELDIMDRNREVRSFFGPSIKIIGTAESAFDVRPEHKEDMVYVFQPNVSVKNVESLSFYLFELERDYTIACDLGGILNHGIQNQRLPLWPESIRVWGMIPEESSRKKRFKLLVTTHQEGQEKLFHQQFLQVGLPEMQDGSGGTKSAEDEDEVSESAKIADDWWVFDMDVTMVRQ